ncbi:MAG: glycosyltransferase family 2 protein [Nitrosarchaeum sp.]
MIMKRKQVGIVIVNYNSWKDTIECLKSIFNQDYSSWHIAIIDNQSSDKSLKHIDKWLHQELKEQNNKDVLHPMYNGSKIVSLLRYNESNMSCKSSN